MKRFLISTIVATLALFTITVECMGKTSPGRSYTYEGKLGSFPIHMTLLFRSDNTVKGYYYYDSQRVKGNMDTILLRGIFTGDIDDGKISLTEYGASGKEIGSFNCDLNGGHETDLEEGITTIVHLIAGSPGYRNYKSGNTYDVELVCVEIVEI